MVWPFVTHTHTQTLAVLSATLWSTISTDTSKYIFPEGSQSEPPSSEPFLQAELIAFPLISAVPAAQRLINVVENRKLSVLSTSTGGGEKHNDDFVNGRLG